MKKALSLTFKILAGLALFCLVVAPFLVEKIDRTPYREMDYYKKMTAQLDTFQLDTVLQHGTFFKAGWAKKNITPSYLPVLAGYGLRRKTTPVHDSVFVRAFVFDNGKHKAAFIAVDLLIFPPIVEERLRARALEMGYAPQNFYFTASHTHHAPGGYIKGPAGKILAGAYNEEYVSLLVASIINAVKEAEKTLEDAEMGLALLDGTKFVRNRLNMPDSKVDPWVRVLKIRKKSGKEALLVTYAAHANCLKLDYTCVSGDYPNRMIQQLEKTGKIDFALYAAGMVGSHVPKQTKKGIENEAFINDYGDSLAVLITKQVDSIKLHTGYLLRTAVLDVYLREPHLKISKDWRVRPWLFDAAFGAYKPTLKLLQLNDVVFIGTPCDFSGELMPAIEPLCKEKNIALVITSFNGGYIGYINVDKYYDADKAEVRDMNWFGPYNQAYFTEIMQRIVKKI